MTTEAINAFFYVNLVLAGIAIGLAIAYRIKEEKKDGNEEIQGSY